MSSLNPSPTLYRETTCEHGLVKSHRWITSELLEASESFVSDCPGGSREEVTIDYEAAAKAWNGTNREGKQFPWRDDLPDMVLSVDAALGE